MNKQSTLEERLKADSKAFKPANAAYLEFILPKP
jgi:hypothetical protein